MAASNAPIWQPTADQATPPRVSLSTRLTSLNELPCSSLFSAGTRQPSNTMSAFCTVRSAYLPSIFVGVKPGVPFSTTKVFTWSSATSRAKTTTTSAKVPLPIQRLAPSMTQPSPSRRAVVSRPRATSEPPWGPGGAKAPRASSAPPAVGAGDGPAVAVAAGRGLQTAGDVGAAVGLGEREGADRVQRHHAGHPAGARLVGGPEDDPAPRRPVGDGRG